MQVQLNLSPVGAAEAVRLGKLGLKCYHWLALDSQVNDEALFKARSNNSNIKSNTCTSKDATRNHVNNKRKQVINKQ
jgi:hypothetical protein